VAILAQGNLLCATIYCNHWTRKKSIGQKSVLRPRYKDFNFKQNSLDFFITKTNKVSLMDSVSARLQARSNKVISHQKGKKSLKQPIFYIKHIFTVLEKSLLLLIQDVNLMHRDKMGNRPAAETLRQWLDHGFWIDAHLQPAHIKVNLSYYQCVWQINF